MVKKQGVVWNYYTKKENGTQVIAFCKFCDQSYIKNATRMERHMERCPKCPEDVRQQFIKVANNKKAKASIFNLKVTDVWAKQEIGPGLVHDWEYQDQNPSMSQLPRQNVHYVIPTNSEWAQGVDNFHQSDPTDKDWTDDKISDGEADQIEDVEVVDGPKTERASPIELPPEEPQTPQPHQRKSTYPVRRKLPAKSLRASTNLSLQGKIYQEQLMERRALRRLAELECRRKTLEMEKLQWEIQRDRAQSEVRWAHETRMMQLREEREQLEIEKRRTQVS